MDSNVGLAIQCVGILLITLLSLFMRGSIRSESLKYWSAAWIGLSLALLNLFIGFQTTTFQKIFYSLYFFGEYMFGLLFIAGCRHYVSGRRLGKKDTIAVVIALVVAVLLPKLSSDFNQLFMVHASILAVLFATSFYVLWSGTRSQEPSPGIHVMFAALFFLTLDFVHYVPVFAARNGLFGFTIPSAYFQYTSIFDLVIEILLGFGTVMVLMEGVRREIENANAKLVKARDQLEMLAQMDPLTEALNRHAFHSLLNRPEGGDTSQTFGSVAIIDIDSLKPINDSLGHSAGDKAIRAVARAMRSLVRADDMLFRWGGDEFLLLMFNLPREEAARRLEGLNQILEANCQHWTGMPITVSVSYGVSGFAALKDLSLAIEAADRFMYQQRQETRSSYQVRMEKVLV
jgi:diguanylate cyclase (GGDEF)-like protein